MLDAASDDSLLEVSVQKTNPVDYVNNHQTQIHEECKGKQGDADPTSYIFDSGTFAVVGEHDQKNRRQTDHELVEYGNPILHPADKRLIPSDVDQAKVVLAQQQHNLNLRPLLHKETNNSNYHPPEQEYNVVSQVPSI